MYPYLLLKKASHERCTTNTMDEASRNEHITVVKFLHVNKSVGFTVWDYELGCRIWPFRCCEIFA